MRLDLRNKVLVPILNARESRLGQIDIVGRLVIFEDRDMLVGPVSILGAEEEGLLGCLLIGNGLNRKDPLGWSAHQLVASGTHGRGEGLTDG